jgi:hypothetical protein
MVTLALVCGFAFVGPVISARVEGSNDIRPTIATLQRVLPNSERLVSLGPIAHRFAYYYGAPIEQLDWPTTADEVPEGVDYFCFDVHRGDTPERRANGRGRQWHSTSGTLPFAWEMVAEIPCDPLRRADPDVTVVIARRKRASDASAGTTAVLPNMGGAASARQ